MSPYEHELQSIIDEVRRDGATMRYWSVILNGTQFKSQNEFERWAAEAGLKAMIGYCKLRNKDVLCYRITAA